MPFVSVRFMILIAIVALVCEKALIGDAFSLSLKSRHLYHTKYGRRTPLRSVPDWLVDDVQSSSNESNLIDADIDVKTITVRFTNTPSGKDLIVNDVPEGTNLLYVGDQNGIALPRACRTGLCGSCTCEVIDPAGVSATGEEGKVTVRACSTRCYVPEGKEELIVDLWRMSKMRKKKSIRSNAGGSTIVEEDTTFSDPMARFSGDWERDFRPQWESSGSKTITSASSRINAKVPDGQRECSKCGGKGRITCYACSGMGLLMMLNGVQEQCQTCMGMKSCACGFCQGTGFRPKKKNF